MNLPGVKNVIAVASGKGGVGKSTVSANLALALAAKGHKVGLMDADVYGPSIPFVLGITEKPQSKDNRIEPVIKYGIRVISMGFFVPENEAVIWRGPMLHKMVQDFLGLVNWGDLDYLLIDLPPGTGDIQLSLCQSIPLTGAVIVSTPQDVAWRVAQKAIVMFDKLNTPIIGVIENMSHHACEKCGHEEQIFGEGGAKLAAKQMEIPFLGDIPLLKPIRETADQGDPIVHRDPNHAASHAFIKITDNLVSGIQKGIQGPLTKPVPKKISGIGTPELTIEWSDGRQSAYAAQDLRLACPCAGCVNEFTGERIVKPSMLKTDLKVASIQPVGRYALHLVWSDGHSTGLYGYDYLRKIEAARKT